MHADQDMNGFTDGTTLHIAHRSGFSSKFTADRTTATSYSVRNLGIRGTMRKSGGRGAKTMAERSINRTKSGLNLVFAALMAANLGACGVSQLTEPLQRGLFGGDSAQNAEGQQATALAGGDGAPQASGFSTSFASVSVGCPVFEVNPDLRTIIFSAPGGGGDPQSVMHQGEILEVARECGTSATGVAVKYGFSGRVLLGPRGKPGSITLPATLTVVDQANAVVQSQKIRVVVNVPGGSTTGVFSEVKEVDVPVPAGYSAKNYKIYIGFDNQANAG